MPASLVTQTLEIQFILGMSSLIIRTPCIWTRGAEKGSRNRDVHETTMAHSLGGVAIGPAGLDELLKFRTAHCGYVVDPHILLLQHLHKKGAVACFDQVVVVL